MEVDEEPWSALDIDETDLSSSTTSLLRRCTHQPPSSTTNRRLIPGPASAIQAAMHRNNHFKEKQGAIISTQEYNRINNEDASDLEFSRNPWVFASEFLRRNGVFDTTPLSSVKSCSNSERFDRVIAIVKSCTPNGLGDMMVTLKDPTDTIGASIHGKVFSIGDFGKFINVGCVLILQKVVVFSSSCVSCYLNITRSNIDKLISIDCEVQSFPQANLENPERVIRDEFQRKGKTVYEDVTQRGNYSQNSSLNCNRNVEIGGNKSFNSGPSKWQGTNSVTNSQLGPGSFDAIFRNLHKDLDNTQNLSQGRDLCTVRSENENLDGNLSSKENDSQSERLLSGNSEKLEKKVDEGSLSTIEKEDDEESRGESGVKKRRMGLVSRSAVQEWTDEQLSALDMDDF